MSKQIRLTIPEQAILPEECADFSPEENFMMIKIGCQCLSEGRKAVVGLTQEEIHNKIKNENRSLTEKMELELLVERETGKKMGEKITKMYEGQVEQLKKQLDSAIVQLKSYELENSHKIEEKIQKEREKFQLLLKEKDEQNRLNREVFDKAANMNKYTSSSKKGDIGEDAFSYLSNTFKDFNGYKIKNMSKQAHKGDFHLFFEEFNVLVDAKKYSTSVQKKEIDKIESDLSTNDNMHFAWLVSLDSEISGWNRFPIMSKCVITDAGIKTIIFVNNLMKTESPENMLRTAWSFCNSYHNMTKKVDKEDGELNRYREQNLLTIKQINNLQEVNSEMRRNLNASSNILKKSDSTLLEMLSSLSNKIIIEHFDKYKKVEDWFDANVEYSENKESDKISSTELWSKFKKDHKYYVIETQFTNDLFKEAIRKVINASNYTEKNKNSPIILFGYKLKEVEIEEVVIENLVLELEKKPQKKEKVEKEKVKKSKGYYFDKEKDNEIIEYYKDDNNNIMTITALFNDVRPWQVVSLLVRHKIICKRDDARGYDIYKQTDEYKSKFNN
jgi:hypothetical protein